MDAQLFYLDPFKTIDFALVGANLASADFTVMFRPAGLDQGHREW